MATSDALLSRVGRVNRTPVLADRIARSRLRDLTMVAAIAGLTALLAQVSIHLPGHPVPVTGQTFAVLLCAAAAGPLRAVAGQSLYIALGWVGLPVFASGTHGWRVVHGATGGYLAGFLLASVLVGWQARHGVDRRADTFAGSFLLGSALIYLPGVWWLAHSMQISYDKAITLGVTPFVLGDLLKAVLAGVVLPSAWRLVRPQ